MGDDATREVLKKQLEFYFGDSNLRRDNFLKKRMDKKTGYMDFATICKFNKMKSISTDLALIKTAVEASDFLELNEAGTKIRRKDKVVIPKMPNDLDDRTAYVENLPEGFTHDSVRAIFETCGKVLNVSLPRFKDTRKFKGFGFIEFAVKDDIAKAVGKSEYSEEKAPKALRVMTKLDWLKVKGKFKDTKVVSCAKPKDYKEEAAAPATPSFKKGCLLRITGIGANAMRNQIKDTVSTAAKVKFVDYFPNDEGKSPDTAIVRFEDGSTADAALKYFAENPTTIGESESAAVFAKLPDDEESAYFAMVDKKSQRSGGRKGGRRGGGRGGGGRKKRSRDDAEAAPAKRAKTEE